MTRKYGWHFARENFKLSYGDNRLIESGITFTVDCKPILCKQGLHDSIKAIDALEYAPGPVVSRTVLSGEVNEESDKRVGTKRKHLWCYDATEELEAFARWCALEVIDLWEAPEVVREYLETGDENLRVEARDTASDAAWYAGWYTASDAASDAASAAARAARAAEWATRYAASDVAKAAAWYAAKAAIWDEMRVKQNKKLEQMLKDGWKKRNE